MSALRLALLALLFLPAAVLAHQINGTVRDPNGRPIQDTVRISCPPPVKESDEQRIDNRGNFSFFIRNPGRCTLSVDSATYRVFSSQNPVRYDLVFERGTLRRR